MKRLIYIPFVFILFFSFSCSDNKENKIEVSPSKQDSILVKDSSLQIVSTEPQINYTGSYKLLVDRFENYIARHSLELNQENDTITGNYSLKVFSADKKLLVSMKGTVGGKMNQTIEDVNSGCDLHIFMTERVLDSIALSSNPNARYAYDMFLYDPSRIFLKFSTKKNTIENNYAGGEWDTWEKIK